LEVGPEPKIIWTSDGATVWHANLARHDEQALFGLLTEGEVLWAGRYGDPMYRRRFVVRRGILRSILASVLDADPRSIGIVADPGGKPRLPDHETEISVAFSGDEALFAASPRTPIGVDIERIDPAFETKGIIADHFSDDERTEMSGLSVEDLTFRFFRAWTRKEACAKALGFGLARALSDYTVSGVKADGLAVSLEDGTRLLVTDLPAPLGNVAAVALEISDFGLRI